MIDSRTSRNNCIRVYGYFARNHTAKYRVTGGVEPSGLLCDPSSNVGFNRKLFFFFFRFRARREERIDFKTGVFFSLRFFWKRLFSDIAETLRSLREVSSSYHKFFGLRRRYALIGVLFLNFRCYYSNCAIRSTEKSKFSNDLKFSRTGYEWFDAFIPEISIDFGSF